MKKIYTYILMIACAAMFAGCQKDFDGIFNAVIEGYNGSDGKVYIDDNYACWNDGDKVMINGDTCVVNTNIEIEGVKTAQIVSNRPTEANTYTAIYPAKFANGEGNKSYTLPQMQKYETVTLQGTTEQTTVQKIDAPMVAYAEWSEDTPTLIFKNAGALVKVIVKNTYDANPITLRRIDLVGSQNATLWGTVSYNQAANADPTMTSITNDATNKNIVSLSFYENPVELAANAEATFYIAIPTTATTTLQPKVYYTTEEDEDKANTVSKNLIRTKSSTNSRVIVRNQMYRMDLTSGTSEDGSIKLFGTGNAEDPYLIFTFADFTRMGSTGGLHFKQMNDFVREDYYKNKNCPIISSNCVYDGNNKTITITADNTYKNSIGVFQEVNGTTNTAIVKNLIVNADINITSTTNANWPIGGIADHAKSNAKFIQCTVNGRIIAEGKERIGGIVGDQSWTLSIDNCTNNAEIKGKKYVGGILGYVANCNNNGSSIANCKNTGTLTSQEVTPGGIIGITGHGQTTPTITNCNPGNYEEIGSSTIIQDGTPEHPYLIATAAEINDLTKCYKLVDDITVSSTIAGEFTGSLDGANHTITTTQPLFQTINGAQITNLIVIANITSNNNAVGAIANKAQGSNNLIENCRVSGTISSQGSPVEFTVCSAGGFIGNNYGTLTINKCVNNANIEGEDGVGGFVATSSTANLEIKNCANHGTISGSVKNTHSGGGIVGKITGNRGTINIKNSYSYAPIKTKCGGIIGWIHRGDITIENVYVGCADHTKMKGKWILYGKYPRGGGSITCTNVYSPSDDAETNGLLLENHDGTTSIILGATKYTVENGTLKVGTETLLNTLITHIPTGCETWTNVNGKPGFAFENQQ